MRKIAKTTLIEIVIFGIIIISCSAIYLETLGLPPGSFEPLGSGFMPRVISGLVIVLCVAMMIVSLRNSSQAVEAKPEPESDRKAGIHLVITTLALAILFHSRLVDFGLLATVFLFTSIMALERFNRKALIPAGIMSVFVGFGFKYVFTKFFVVDLPVWF